MTSTDPPLARGHGRLRLHGRRPLPGLAHRAALLRPAADPGMLAVCGRDAGADRRGGRTGSAGPSTETDWRRVVERDDIDLVDICTPGDTHAEIAIAALAAGKHVLCEKPLANTVAEAEAMAAAAEQAAAHGVRAMVGFTYRRVPAIALARQLVAEGRLGDDPARPRAVPAGLDRRPGGAAVVAAGQGQGRLRRARRHRRAHRRPDPVHHRPDRSPGSAAMLETFVEGAARSPTEHAARSAASAGTAAGPGHRRRRRGLPRPVHRRRARRLRGDPVRDRPQERHPDRDQRLGRQPGLRLRGHERPAVLRRQPSPPRPPASGGSSSPSPSTPTSAPGGRPATGSATSTASPTRSSTW